MNSAIVVTDANRPPTCDHMIAALHSAGWTLNRASGRWRDPNGGPEQFGLHAYVFIGSPDRQVA